MDICIATKVMHRSIAGYNPYNLFILTKYYSKNFTTNKLLAIGHMPMFVVKSIVIQINGLAYGSINYVVIYTRYLKLVYVILYDTTYNYLCQQILKDDGTLCLTFE